MVNSLHFISILFICCCAASNFEALRDDILFQINWPGTSKIDLKTLATPGIEYNLKNSFDIASSNNEKYRCTVPSLADASDDVQNEEDAESKSIVKLLAPVFKSDVCTSFIEAYWTYELCYGKHIRQYHEERIRKSTGKTSDTYVVKKGKDGKLVLEPGGDDKQELTKTTEFFLGYFKEKIDDDGVLINPKNFPTSAEQVPRKKINGMKTPYYAINMTDGTPCDLKDGNGRRSVVLYVCGQLPRPNLLSVTETSSCEYELIVLTPALCKHPFYKMRRQSVNDIQCLPLEDAPAKPRALLEFNQQQAKDSPHSSRFPSIVDEEPTKNELHRVENTKISSLVDKSLLRDFLSGSYCLQGGSGWWRFEFCYGRYVQQYHDEKRTRRTTITVGTWSEEDHKKWASNDRNRAVVYKNKEGKTERKVTQVAHFYGNGDMCDEAGNSREVVVRMTCQKGATSPHSVAIYMLEPSTCSYILNVESMIFCDLLETADESGLLTLQ